MRFGKSAKEAAEEPSRGGGGNYIRYLKEGNITFRICQEPDEWTYYWEHFSPLGFSFPCPRAKDDPVEDCPGCSSDNEKMKKVSRKIAFNALHSINGQEYVDVYAVGPMVADKLENRFKRFTTVTDRDYTISKYKTSGDRWDFDVEGSTPTPMNLRKEDWQDIEAMLVAQWEEHWGDPNQAAANLQGMAQVQPAVSPVRVSGSGSARPTIAAAPQQEEPPFEEQVYQEADLRKMDRDLLIVLIQQEMKLSPPTTLTTSDAIVDWLMELQS